MSIRVNMKTKTIVFLCVLLISVFAVSCTDDEKTGSAVVGTWKYGLKDNDIDVYWHFQSDGTWVKIIVYGSSGKVNVMKDAYFFENGKLYLDLREASCRISNNKLAIGMIDEEGRPLPAMTFTRVPDDVIEPYLEQLRNEEYGAFISNQNVNEFGIITLDEVNVRLFSIDKIPASYSIQVEIPQKVAGVVKACLKIDNNLVKVYNESAHKGYLPVPDENIRFVNPEVTITQGERLSDVATVELLSTEGLQEGGTYLIPVTIESVSGGVTRINHRRNTVFLKVVM